MSTLRRRAATNHESQPFTDTRTVVIALVASLLSLGAGASTAAAVAAASVSPSIVVVAGVSAWGTAMVFIVAALHKLIR